jgi:hypothetical protein
MHIFRHIFLSNYWWQKFDIWSQASYKYPISWEAFLNPSDSYFLFADFFGFYTHWTYMYIFLSNYWWQKSDIWSQASYKYPISWEAFLDPSDSYFLYTDFVDFYTHLTYICICTFFVAFFSATIDDRNLIFGHKLHIGIPYSGADPGFQVRGGAHFKKNLGYFVWKNHHFTPKNHIFSNFRGETHRVRPPPWIHPWFRSCGLQNHPPTPSTRPSMKNLKTIVDNYNVFQVHYIV